MYTRLITLILFGFVFASATSAADAPQLMTKPQLGSYLNGRVMAVLDDGVEPLHACDDAACPVVVQ